MAKKNLSAQELRDRATANYEREMDRIHQEKKATKSFDKLFNGAIACAVLTGVSCVVSIASLAATGSTTAAIIAGSFMGASAIGSAVLEVCGTKNKKTMQALDEREKACFDEYAEELDKINAQEKTMTEAKQEDNAQVKTAPKKEKMDSAKEDEEELSM